MKELTLPSGRTATIKKGQGFHLLAAQRKSRTNDEIPYALVAELAEIEGNKFTYEELLEMDIADVSMLLTEVNKLGKSTTPSPLSSSANLQDGDSAK